MSEIEKVWLNNVVSCLPADCTWFVLKDIVETQLFCNVGSIVRIRVSVEEHMIDVIGVPSDSYSFPLGLDPAGEEPPDKR